MRKSTVETALTIAGSDSGGGAGIQADLKTFAIHCVHGASALTCVTAQNTVGVGQIQTLNSSIVEAQIEAVAVDFQVNAVKTGMLPTCEIIEAVAAKIEEFDLLPLVVDPVMVSRTGAKLIDDGAIARLKKLLIPQATIVTPNRYEAQILSGIEIDSLDRLKQAAIAIYDDLGVKAVLVKGGGLSGANKGIDVWYDGTDIRVLSELAVLTQNTHGTGCTLSAAICANLALNQDLWTSVTAAKQYVTTALKNSLDIGAGNGPVGHFFPWLKNAQKDSI